MVGFCHLTDSHHYHLGQKPTMVGICHGGNMPVGLDYWLYSAKITGWTVGPASYTKCYSCVHQILKIGSFNSAGWTVRDVPDVSNFPLFVRLPADVKSRILQCTDKCDKTKLFSNQWQLILCLMSTSFLIIVVTHIPRMALF